MEQSEGAQGAQKKENRLLVFNNNFYIYLCHFGVAVIVARVAGVFLGGGGRVSRVEQTSSRRVALDLQMPRCRLGSSSTSLELPAALLACQTKIFNTCAINYCQPWGEEGGRRLERAG